MTNPFPVSPTDIDIRASAYQVIERLRQGRTAEALRMLEREREGERPVVQEALDRYVAAGSAEQMDALRREELPVAMQGFAQVLTRLQGAMREPRMPAYSSEIAAGAANELAGLTRTQIYDVYASIVETRGNQAAHDALRRNGESVLLGLRRENSTLASIGGGGRAGTGVYDDHLIVLRRGANGERDVYIADRANTEPTAQYDHNAGSNGSRVFSDSGRLAPRRAVSPGYEDVARPRKIEGRDANGDGTRDLGRLEQATIEMQRAEHPRRQAPGQPGDYRSLRPTLAAVEQGAGQMRRDTNGDGYFTAADVNGVDDLNDTIKIHEGSRHNTDSAACQTIHPDQYRDFMDAAGVPVNARDQHAQTRWQYVLTHTTEGIFRNVHTGQRAAADAAPEAPPLRRQPGADPERQPGAPRRGPEGGGPQAGRRVPRTADDEYLERFLAATDRGDHAGRAELTLVYAQRPEVRELDHLARSAVAGEREQAVLAAQQHAWQADVPRQSPQAMVLGG